MKRRQDISFDGKKRLTFTGRQDILKNNGGMEVTVYEVPFLQQ